MIFVYILLGLVVFITMYLVVIIFLPILSVKQQPLNRVIGSVASIPDCREYVEYPVNGDTIRSWLYIPPDRKGPVPCIILCNGFGGTKDIVLEKYALGFVAEGFGALALEYRHFGESDGDPRQIFSFRKQEEDIRASIAYVRSEERFNPDQIIIWGTSAGGVYGINMAAEDHGIAGVIAQCTGLDHKKDSNLVMKREGISYLLRLIVHAQRDKGRGRFNLSEHTVPLVGKPGTLAMLIAPGAHEGYSGMVPETSLFENKICARALLDTYHNDPVKNAPEVKSPALICVCEKDEIVAPDSHVRVAEILGEKVTVRKYPIGHFEIYRGHHFDKAFRDQIDFLKEIL